MTEPVATSSPPRGLTAIVAMSQNRVIGKEGRLPWHLPEDLRRFRQLTWGHAVLMGRKTFASIGKALPGRSNLVVSSDAAFNAPGCIVCASPAAALHQAYQLDAQPYVIGGASLYATLWPQIDRLELTWIERSIDGDTWFPAVDWQNDFREVHRQAASGTADVWFITLERKTLERKELG